MQDASSAAPAKAKVAGKVSKSGGAEASEDGKKRFEVKKVGKRNVDPICRSDTATVECSRTLGLGYCSR